MGIDDLIQALQENPDLEASTTTLLPFVDGPEFFKEWLNSKEGTPIANYKVRLYAKERNGLSRVIKEKKDIFKEYLESNYHSLDEMGVHTPLGSALSAGKSRKAIAMAIAKSGLVSLDIPTGYPLTYGGSRLTWYLDDDVVGPEQKKKNLQKHINENYKTVDGINNYHNNNLDNLDNNQALSSLFGLKGSQIRELARLIVDKGFMSPKLPEGHALSKSRGHVSCYADKYIVREKKKENIQKFVEREFETLDDITCHNGLGAALGVKNKITKLVQVLVNEGYMNTELPEGHPSFLILIMTN